METQAASTPRGKRTRDTIVDAAAGLMYVDGVAGTSVDKVLAASGAGKSQMYHYFKNKEQLVEAVIDRYLEQILGNQPAIFTLSSWADLETWTGQLLDIHRRAGKPVACPLGNLAGEVGDNPKLAPLVDRAYRTWESHLERGLKVLQANGELAPDADPARLAQAAMTSVQGGLLLAHIRHDLTALEDALDIALTYLRSHATS
ncbi:TetR/AcrR family transcriptional regulator [Amycolatopsis sp. NPDC004625]|uniref:TetR/AcrR family transcriptional regulator n=1 Tax=Amycolatopsis sp. NPDC004625 TaxID=3154670 RepID=UPI0033AD7D19